MLLIIFFISTVGKLEVYIYPVPRWTGFDTIAIFKQSKAGMNSVCFTKVKEQNLPYYLTRAGERTDGFMHFSKALVQLCSKFELGSPI